MNKKITTDALQLALILTLLTSGSYNPSSNDSDFNDPEDSSGYPDYDEPELISEYNSSWGSTYYSQTRAYRRNGPDYDPVSPYFANKGLLLIDPEPLSPIEPEFLENLANVEPLNPLNFYRERILDELRKLKYNSSPTDSAKVPRHNHNLTAYILSNTTEFNSLNGFTLRLPDFQQYGHGHRHVENQATVHGPSSSFISMGIVEESEGDNGNADEPSVPSTSSNLLIDESNEIESMYEEKIPEEEDQQLEEHNFFTQLKCESPAPGPLPSILPIENAEHVVEYNEHEQGAPALPESWSPLQGGEADYNDEWLQASYLQLEKLESKLYTFEDASEEELRNVISPLALHRFDDELIIKKEDTTTDEELVNELLEFESLEFMKKDINQEDDEDDEVENLSGTINPPTTEVDIRRRGISSSAGSISSHDEPATSHDDDNPIDEVSSVVGDVLDDLWEADSGIFDFLDSPPPKEENGNKETDFLDELFENIDGELDDSGNINSGPNSSATDEMLQTAPIHPAVRPTSHSAQPRGFQVHARMPGILRGGSMNQSWQEIASLLSFQPSAHGDHNVGIPGSLPHHHPFGSHHHHHPFVHPHHPIHHHSPFSTPGHHPPPSPYNSDASRVLLQNATIPPPELTNSTLPYSSVGMGPTPNLGSALASSMHLTNNTEPMPDPGSHYNKMLENPHDMLYYQNSSTTNPATEINSQGTEGIFSSFLNEEDLQIMDMAMNEGMCTMRTLDYSAPNGNESSLSTLGQPVVPLPGTGATSNEDRLEASSDSAVSSMGSERIPMTDDQWSESDHHPSPYSLDYTNGKLGRTYDYGYSKEGSRVGVPVAQKKHQMFGKRFQQEQGPPHHTTYHPSSLGPIGPYSSSNGPPIHHNPNHLDHLEMKYSCSLDFTRNHDTRIGNSSSGTGSRIIDLDLAHNHTYALPPSHSDNGMLTNLRSPRASSNSSTKEKQPKMIKDFKSSEEHLSRDEKRARSLCLPMTTDDIINLPMDEFNERLSKYDLSETQLSLIRDIRRRGKNKVAAQNCRKRKLDQINQLATEVDQIREKKQKLAIEQEVLRGRKNQLQDKYTQLYRHVFQALRGSDGNPYSPYDYSLQMAADGNIILVPRNGGGGSTSANPGSSTHSQNSVDPLDISSSSTSSHPQPPHHRRSHPNHKPKQDESSKKE